MEAILDVPEGFERHDRKSPVTNPWEPLYRRFSGDTVILGLRAGAAHTNSRGFVHGGLISTLADNAMGLSCARRLGDLASLVTVNLTVDFLGSALTGQWLEFDTVFVKPGGTVRVSCIIPLLTPPPPAARGCAGSWRRPAPPPRP